jgi:serine/threonine-protein kinase
MPLPAGARLGPYQIDAPIGAGGMGEVYRAKDTKLGRDVALKILPASFTDDPERVARFRREAQVLASLNHPHIAQIYGLDETSGTQCLVLELVDGESLDKRIARGRIPVDEALGIAKQIAEALEAAHEKGIIHRDLKPANIALTKDGNVKVLDFGLAKANEATSEAAFDAMNAPTTTSPAMLTGVGRILGTAAYMSPEQARGSVLDPRTDVWAFGAVLYEMLAGKRAFSGDSVADTLANVMDLDPDWSALPKDLLPAVDDLVRRCLTKNRKQRLQAIGEARIVLENPRALRGPAGAAPPARSRLTWVAWSLAVVALIALAVVSFVHFSEQPTAQTTRFSVDLGPDAVAGPRITAAISSDGQRIAFIARTADGTEQLATRRLDEAVPTLLAGTNNATDPFFSPDGRWIGFFADGKMKKIPVQGGATVALCEVEGARGASWGDDGNIIATLGGSNNIGLSRIPDVGGAPQTLSKPKEGEVSHRWPQILPGGQDVLFTSSTVNGVYDDGFLAVLSLKTGQWKTVQKGGYFGRYVPAGGTSGYLIYVHQTTLFGVPFDLGRMETRGEPVRLLEDVAGDQITAAGQFDISRNGTLIYLAGKAAGQAWSIAWLDSEGKMQPLLPTPGNYVAPRFSPDGKRLALTTGIQDIQVYDIQRGFMTRLTSNNSQNTYPVWAPGGRHIAFRAQRGSDIHLDWIRSDGGGQEQTLLTSKTELRLYSFSPDGKRLAYAENSPDTNFDIYTLPLDLSDPEHPKPGQPELFLKTPLVEYEPAFSPDRRWMAYTSFESGAFSIYVRPFPGPGGRWKVSGSEPGSHPIWSLKSHELFYEAAAGNRIMVVSYSAKNDTFDAERPRTWSNARLLEPLNAFWNMDLAPDGRFAVFPAAQAGEQKGSVRVTVVLNFVEEIRRKIPAGQGQ